MIFGRFSCYFIPGLFLQQKTEVLFKTVSGKADIFNVFPKLRLQLVTFVPTHFVVAHPSSPVLNQSNMQS